MQPSDIEYLRALPRFCGNTTGSGISRIKKRASRSTFRS